MNPAGNMLPVGREKRAIEILYFKGCLFERCPECSGNGYSGPVRDSKSRGKKTDTILLVNAPTSC
jgi:hypothetical protein